MEHGTDGPDRDDSAGEPAGSDEFANAGINDEMDMPADLSEAADDLGVDTADEAEGEDDASPSGLAEGDGLSDSDVEGTHSKVTKVRGDAPEASIFDREGGGGANGRIALGVATIVGLAVIAAFLITRSAQNTDLKLVEASVQETLTADCFWSIVFELENTTDDRIAVFDASVFTGRGDLIVTQAARDMVVEANSTAQNAITYYVDNCPGDPSEIDHGSLDVLNASFGGVQQTTRLEF